MISISGWVVALSLFTVLVTVLGTSTDQFVWQMRKIDKISEQSYFTGCKQAKGTNCKEKAKEYVKYIESL